jgi:hypothetical protein
MGDTSSRKPAPGSIDWAATQFRRILDREEVEREQRRRLQTRRWRPLANQATIPSVGPVFGDGRDELADLIQSGIDQRTAMAAEARRLADVQIAQTDGSGSRQGSPRPFRKLPRDDSDEFPWNPEAHDLAFENTSRHEGYDGRIHNDGVGVPTIGHGYALLVRGSNGWSIRDDENLAVLGKALTGNDRRKLQQIADDLNRGIEYSDTYFEDVPGANDFDLSLDRTEARWLFDLAATKYWHDAVSGAGEDNFRRLRPEQQAVLFDFAYRGPSRIRGNSALRQALSNDLAFGSWDNTGRELLATVRQGDRRAGYNVDYLRNPLAENVYTVQRGDTWEGVLKRTGMNEEYLAAINGIVIPEDRNVRLYAGQRLYIRPPQKGLRGRIR